LARRVSGTEDDAVPFVDLPSGIRICHETFGDPADPTVLLLHGLGSQMLVWDEGFCCLLAGEGFRVVRSDHRDSGLSTILEEGAPPYSLSDMAADAVGLLDALDLADVHVVGFSLGGMVAQTIAVEHPGRCRSLVSMGSATGSRDVGRPAPETSAAMLAEPPPDAEGALSKDLSNLRLWASDWHDEDHARAKYQAYRRRSVQPRHAYVRQWGAAQAAGNREAALATIRVPTRVIHGTRDTLILPSAGERTAEVIPGADLVLVEGWGHDVSPGGFEILVSAIVDHCHAVEATR
jgi:pimeloyl-ACP methyl ester carboxylesterase